MFSNIYIHLDITILNGESNMLNKIKLRKSDNGKYHQCNKCGSLIYEGKKEMQSWGWCPICYFPRFPRETIEVDTGRYWDIFDEVWKIVEDCSTCAYMKHPKKCSPCTKCKNNTGKSLTRIRTSYEIANVNDAVCITCWSSIGNDGDTCDICQSMLVKVSCISTGDDIL